MKMGRVRAGIAAFAWIVWAAGVGAQQHDWPTHGGNPGGNKYSELSEINLDNANQLVTAWSWETGEEPLPLDASPVRGQMIAPGKLQATPIVLDGVMYLSTSYNRVVALEAATGKELWSYDPRAYEWGRPARGCGFCHRGVAIWMSGDEKRIFMNSRWSLIALDAVTGEPIDSFGKGGVVDLTENLMWHTNKLLYSNTSPPVVYEDIVIVGSGVPDGRVFRQAPPGDVQAFDARSGAFLWSFHTVPQKGEYGNDTWEDDSWSYTGAANVWAPFTVDAERGLVYLPVSTPTNDFYGGHRKGDNLFAESIVCLDAKTGKRVWHFQTVHHGIWDYDIPSPPNLVTLEVDGRTIDAVAVVTKTGFVFVFDRVTGEPVWPIEERPVPASDVPGERASPTQPFPIKPPPFGRQGFTEDDLIDFTPELKAKALEAVATYRLGPMFTPPSLEGTLTMPGVWGSANWGGAAFDPETGKLYVNATNWPGLFRITKGDPKSTDAEYTGRGMARVVDGLPLHKPPYATLTAYNLNEGELLWQVTLGDAPEFRKHPALEGLDIPPMGVAPPQHGQGGPLVTRGGLIFISATSEYLHVFDKTNGELVTEFLLDGSGFGNPMTFVADGHQYVAIATSHSDGSAAKIVAFSLPR